MPDLLLELFSEEIPASMQRKAASDLKKMMEERLQKHSLSFKESKEYSTPRRLVLHVQGLAESTPGIEEEIRGPLVSMPKEAIDGFLSKVGFSSIAEASIRTNQKGKGDFYVAQIFKEGRRVDEVIAEIVPAIIKEFSWSTSMRWGKESIDVSSLRWIRPLQSILCILSRQNCDTQIVPFQVGDMIASNTTYGHRFHSPQTIIVHDFQDYKQKLEEAKVILDPEERKTIIRKKAENLLKEKELSLYDANALLEEVTGLVEWPFVLLGKFDPSFLTLPSELIECTIRLHQKCFVTISVQTREKEEKTLSPYFMIVSNIEPKDGGKKIVEGNQRVIHARLSDSLYFWEFDQKSLPDKNLLNKSLKQFNLDLDKMLDQRMAKLHHMRVTFHARIGTQADRVVRICVLSKEIASILGADTALVERAALLAKADLQTMVVSEFPELQGIIGRQYALLQGENMAVADAILDHYKPKGSSDSIPSSLVSISLALAEKIDMLVCFQWIDEWPTSSRDPYSLRRCAMGIVKIIVSNSLKISLKHILYKHVQDVRNILFNDTKNQKNMDVCNKAIFSFIQERFKVYIRDCGLSCEILEAIYIHNVDDFVSIVRHVKIMEDFLATEKGRNVQLSIKRVMNILSAEDEKYDFAPLENLFQHEEEKKLFDTIEEIKKHFPYHMEEDFGYSLDDKREDFSSFLACIASLQDPIDSFFQNVLVHDPDTQIRENRLCLLQSILSLTEKVADFTKINQ